MNKPQPQKPLMLAYIIFLCVCCVVKIIGDMFSYEFIMWPKIVVAATIASYFFSMSTLPKLNAKMMRKAHNNILEQNRLYTKICNHKNIISKSPSGKKALDYAEQTQLDNEEKLAYHEKEIAEAEKRAFRWDIYGFLSFFCIFTFDEVYMYFYGMQEMLTLLAFIIVLGVDYLDSIFIKKYEDQAQDAINTLNELLTILEESEHGQT